MDNAELEYLAKLRYELLYRIQLSALYHQKRERFFDLLDKLTKAVAIFGGSAALSKLTTPDALVYIASAITATSTASLVFGLSDRSKRHSELARNFRTLESKIVSKGERDYVEADLSQWTAEERGLEASEPPALGALVVSCQNELAAAGGRLEMVIAIPLWQRLTMNFVDWNVRVAH